MRGDGKEVAKRGHRVVLAKVVMCMDHVVQQILRKPQKAEEVTRVGLGGKSGAGIAIIQD